MAVDSWATIDDVAFATGVTVNEEQLAQAQEVIDIYSNRTRPASASLRDRDVVWLRKATCWQAAWQSQQFGFTAQKQLSNLSQDGLKVQFPNENALTLAPLAARALKNLSWKGSRTLRVPSVEVATGVGMLIDYSLEASDDLHDWEPM